MMGAIQSMALTHAYVRDGIDVLELGCHIQFTGSSVTAVVQTTSEMAGVSADVAIVYG